MISSLSKSHVDIEKDKESSEQSRSEMYGIVEESALAYIANLRHSVANEPIASTRLRT